jgi:hypothetical protein
LAIELDGFGRIPRDSLAMLKGASQFRKATESPERSAATVTGEIQ